MRINAGLFRGKSTTTGEWLYGSLLKITVQNCPLYMIFEDNFVVGSERVKAISHGQVDPDTIGECSGLPDKNGNVIYEGDLCLCDRHINTHLDKKVYQIFFDHLRGFFGENFCEISADEFYMAEIIGNIHDNPELLKGGEG